MQMHSKKRDIWSEPKQQVAFLLFIFLLKATQCHFNKAPVGISDDRKKPQECSIFCLHFSYLVKKLIY